MLFPKLPLSRDVMGIHPGRAYTPKRAMETLTMRTKIPTVTDEQIAAMGTAPMTARAIEQNYGGDPAKAAICQAIDNGRKPHTRVYLVMNGEPQATYRSGVGTDREVPFIPDFLHAAGQLVFEGALKTNGKKEDGTEILNVGTVADVNAIIERALTFAYNKEEAVAQITKTKKHLRFLEEHNRDVDFKAIAEGLDKAYAAIRNSDPAGTADYRPVVTLARKADHEGDLRVNTALYKRGVAMLRGSSLDSDKFGAQLQAALDAGDRNQLLDLNRELRQTGGQDPAFADRPQGGIANGNRGGQDSYRGRDTLPGSKKRRNFEKRDSWRG